MGARCTSQMAEEEEEGKKISGRSDRDAKLGMKDCQHRSVIKRPTCMSPGRGCGPNKAVGTPSAWSAAPERRGDATGNGDSLAGQGQR